MGKKSKGKNRGEFVNILRFMGKNRTKYVVLMLINNIIAVFCYNIVFALVSKNLFNAVTERKWALFSRAIIIISVTTIISVVFQPFFTYTINKYVKKTTSNIRIKTYQHLTNLSIAYFEKKHSGNIISFLTNDIKIIEDTYRIHLDRLVFTVVLGLGSIAIMLTLEWRFSIILIFVGAVSILVNNAIVKRIKKTSDDIQQTRGELNERFIDLVTSLETTKIFQIENIITDRYVEKNNQYAKHRMKLGKINSIINTSNYILNSVRTFGVISLGIYMVMIKQVDIGTVVAIYMLQGHMSYMFTNLGNFLTEFQISMAGARRVLEFLAEPVEPACYLLGDAKQEITTNMVKMENINFSYEHQKYILNNINIVINEGQSVAFVGPSGGGKSTIIKLLLGFYSPGSGTLIVNGRSIDQYSLDELRNNVSYVPQESFLFDGTIFENIRYGNLESTEEEVLSAAKSANAHEFIIKLPEGYNTMVGENGVNLSGGQKQRIAIARALIKKAKLLILDEATSALDYETEYKIQEVLNDMMREKTLIIIAHRLSTLKKVDMIYVIDKGKVVEFGNHNKLISKNKFYTKLCKVSNGF